MRIISPQFIALSGVYIMVAAAIVLPFPADVAGIASSPSGTNPPVAPYHPPFSRRNHDSVIRLPRELAQRSTTSTGSTMPPASGGTDFTSRYQVLQPTDLSSTPEAQDANPDIWHPRFGVPRLSASAPGSITTTLTPNLHNVRDALQLDAISATPSSTSTTTPSPSATTSASCDFFSQVILYLMIFMPCYALVVTILKHRGDNSHPLVGTANHNTTQAPVNSSTESASTTVEPVTAANFPSSGEMIAVGVDANDPSFGATIVAGANSRASSPVGETIAMTDAKGSATSSTTDVKGLAASSTTA